MVGSESGGQVWASLSTETSGHIERDCGSEKDADWEAGISEEAHAVFEEPKRGLSVSEYLRSCSR